jgi:hypothetical protein
VEIMQVGHEQRSSRVAGCRHESAEFSGQSTGMKQDFPHRGTVSGSVAVFVDGENLSHVHAGAVVTEAERLGARGIRRVYGAAVKVAGWRQQGTFRIVDCGPGKNGADIMLALEALEAVLLEGVRHVVIASSDGDFTPLALKLAESGAQVTGIGQNKAPDGFRRACTKFVELANATPAKTPPAPNPFDHDRVVRWLETEVGQTEGQDIALQSLGARMHQKYQVTKARLPVADWATFIARLDRFEIVGSSPAGRRVRFAKRKRPPVHAGHAVASSDE